MLKNSIQIGTMPLHNRLVMPPMATYKTLNGGTVNAALCDYYADRARDGRIGLIITEHTCISPEGLAGKGQMSMMDDSVIEPAKKLTEVIKASGSKAVCQLNHAGSATNETLTGMQIVSASAVPCPGRKKELETDMLPKELTKEEILKLEEAFAQAALRAKKAGYDGVEIHSAHGYLLNQFYSPLTNKRQDEYGCGSMENRLRFAIETVKRTRELVGEDYPIFLRLGGCDYMEGGSTIEDAVEAAKLLEAAGVDCIDLSGGMCRFMRPGHNEPGYFSDMSAAVKAAVQIPVILTGGIKTAAQAEELLEKGAADLIGVGRPILADAKWAEKEMK